LLMIAQIKKSRIKMKMMKNFKSPINLIEGLIEEKNGIKGKIS